ncbi:MAG: hypothetical protein KF763_11770 [Cyclobacteriaceae bacterium]|nr:hypothetical protein [Cyclobacteriaceae bacterium]
MRRTKNHKNSEKISFKADGIDFGKQRSVQFKISHKDLILVAGILVALLILFTTWMWDVQSQAESLRVWPDLNVTQTVFHKIGNVISSRF